MALSCGIIGLPNVGKSTLFNALTAARVQADNFPFCTIEPNTGVAAVADPRLQQIARIAQSAKVVPATVHFVDVAGLVKGAAQGEGLGNKFLGHIRDTSAIVHVLRCFQDDNVVHVHGEVDPLEDAQTVHLELVLADLDSLQRAIEAARRNARDGSREKKQRLEQLIAMTAPLEAGVALRRADLSPVARQLAAELRLITAKPLLYLANVADGLEATADFTGSTADMAAFPQEAQPIAALAEQDGAGFMMCCNRLEEELAQLDQADKQEMLAGLGLAEPALNRLAHKAYEMLGLMTFFTAGPKEARAWTVRRGSKAPQAAGAIHSDMERGFIRAEILHCEQYVALGGEAEARRAGVLRLEGKDYLMQDGDIAHFRFHVG